MNRAVKITTALSIGALLVALCFPALRWLVSEWLGNDYYSHGFLVPLISGAIAWRLWVRWPAMERKVESATVGLIPAVLGLGIYLYALSLRAFFVASLAMILLIAGLVWFLLGARALRRLSFPILFLLFMVPLPFVEPFSIPMASFTGVVSASVVRLFGVPVIVSGSQITLPGVDLVVGAQCSGLRSIVALFTLVALVVFLVTGRWYSKALLALSSIPIAIFGNVMRVSSLLVVARKWGSDVGFHYYHDYSSIVFFLSAVVLLILFSRWVGCREIREDIF